MQDVDTIDPIGFWETQTLIHYAKVVATDSGGVIKEAYYHWTPCVIMDRQTEWLEAVDEGWAVIAGPDRNEILKWLKDFPRPKSNGKVFGDGKAAERIVGIIEEYFCFV